MWIWLSANICFHLNMVFPCLDFQLIEDIIYRNHLPVIVGGTNFYIQVCLSFLWACLSIWKFSGYAAVSSPNLVIVSVSCSICSLKDYVCLVGYMVLCWMSTLKELKLQTKLSEALSSVVLSVCMHYSDWRRSLPRQLMSALIYSCYWDIGMATGRVGNGGIFPRPRYGDGFRPCPRRGSVLCRGPAKLFFCF